MFSLPQKKKEQEEKAAAAERPSFQKLKSIRSTQLTNEYPELEGTLPDTCEIRHDDVDDLRNFKLIITPDEGHWKNGSFVFEVTIPTGYNMRPPICKCLTRIWHPNITEDGKICLSILRENALDAAGWTPVRTLKDVCLGLNSLFTDLLNFEDPLNIEAAEHYNKDPISFGKKVRDYVSKYAQDFN